MSAKGETNKDSYLMVEFRYGPPKNSFFKRYTDWTLDVVDNQGNTYSSVPAMDVRLPERVGTLNDMPLQVDLPFDDFTDWILSGEPLSPIYVTVKEKIITEAEQVEDRHFVGRAKRYIKYPQGNRKKLSILCGTWKSNLLVPLGFPCDQQCVWTVGDKNCQAPGFKAAQAEGLIEEIDGTQVKITGLPGHGDDPTKHFWENGRIQKDGIRIVIRSWHHDTPTIFELFESPPAAWLNTEVTVVPGCDYRVKTCDLRWHNLEHFMGPGIAIPAHAPNLQVPAQGDP